MDETYDVVVLGSGAAGMTAALRAAQGGLKVLVVEKTARLGGTSAMSGAGTWVPANHIAAKAGVQDSSEEALTYLHAVSPAGWESDEAPLWRAFAYAAPQMLKFVEAHTPLRFKLVDEPDPFPESPGGKSVGRMVTPKVLSRRILGRFSRSLRDSTLVTLFDYDEMVRHDPYHHPIRTGLRLLPQLARRWLTRSGGQGTALMAGLIKGCLDLRCTFLLRTRACRLVSDKSGRVTAVEVEHDGSKRVIAARRGVVLATGGFEWDTMMRKEFFPGPVDRIGSPRTNEGDGQKMASEAGALLARMDQANIYPCLPTRYEGRSHGLPVTYQAEPHSIIVNRDGRRFLSEYDFNIGEILDQRDPETGEPVHLPAWLIADIRFLGRSLPFRWYASYDKRWTVRADTLEDLAGKIGLSPQALADTVKRFNTFCDEGVDRDFGRGTGTWDTYKSHGSNNTLGKIEKGPYLAFRLNRSILGTKGGARTNASGQVLRTDGSVLEGLYAAGLAMANPIGTRAVGAGTTIGPNMTWGFICAGTILGQGKKG
ncbi:FAD-dependent oxidoreductase [Acetobacter sp. TBRC 12305]|uniref:FAD-dependent oxidoreductase n=2 Tax=Acetobacter garciniae TaxID=2817435 RepID=A0A939HR59_9PROT|nr:FAD-dependent oxidoreductase [Acetobacter garciniae]MBO1326101.1 FAD-dependent oxidoreductase [Acetobacter garciniae]MBX0345154.1 FAD-dependent oxidoreductase [Acetobacter garciniae]